MSNSLYENYFSGDSNSKAKDDHNFELGSFDANMMQENINNQTLGSSRRDEENNINNKLIKNESKFQQSEKILEDIEEKPENNKINNLKTNNKIVQKNEIEIEKEKEKEENPFNKKSSLPRPKKNSKSKIIMPPLIDRISDLKFDFNNYNANNLTKREKEFYEKDIDERKNENEKLKQQYEKELQTIKEAVDNLKEQNKNNKEKLLAQTEEKINELIKNEELMTQNLEKEQKYSEKLIKDEEENIIKLNEKKLELKKKNIENQKEILKRQNEYEMKYKIDELKREQESEKEMDASNINNNKQIEDLLILLNQQSNIQKDIEENLKENENLKQIINNKENEIEIENKRLLNKREEFLAIQNENQRRVLMLKDELFKEKKRINELERNIKKEEIKYEEE